MAKVKNHLPPSQSADGPTNISYCMFTALTLLAGVTSTVNILVYTICETSHADLQSVMLLCVAQVYGYKSPIVQGHEFVAGGSPFFAAALRGSSRSAAGSLPRREAGAEKNGIT